ncbi:MAG: hypothetical protein PHX21_11470 [bacterium]|nr:hypothetical protein [bacterium]
MWEKCPKCGSIFIEWDGERGCYKCLMRKCQNKWTEWDTSIPEKQEDVKNFYLRLSLSIGNSVPYSTKTHNSKQ